MAEPTATRKDMFDEVYGQGLGYYYFNAHNQVRLHQSAFYEKVALLDGGTVALTITAVIGKVQGQIKHPFALKSGTRMPGPCHVDLIRPEFLLDALRVGR